MQDLTETLFFLVRTWSDLAYLFAVIFCLCVLPCVGATLDHGPSAFGHGAP